MPKSILSKFNQMNIWTYLLQSPCSFIAIKDLIKNEHVKLPTFDFYQLLSIKANQPQEVK